MLANDLSPEVLNGVNGAVADGFTALEDLANQIVDLPDANSTSESMLTLLGNTFGLKLRSNDPTMWRRQIKRAVPLYKKKGTLLGLTEALGQAGIKLAKFTKLWQVNSKYTHQEAFAINADSTMSFTLAERVILPTDTNNTEVYTRDVGESSLWVRVDSSNIDISDDGEISHFEWIGNDLPIGSSIRIVYKTLAVPNGNEQDVENYIRTLPLADQRDERNQQYPLKNWNVKVISEDDALFDDVIAERHPFHDPVVWGWVRTEFAYSENVYNMEEYNGSKRQSINPCDIDKDFLDPCSQGLSSKYTVDLEIDTLSSDRIVEATDIIRDYTPFHAVLHSINLYGGINDFVQPPIEEINALIKFSVDDFALTNVQTVFNRSMERSNIAEDIFIFSGNYKFNLTQAPILPMDDSYAVFVKKVNTSNWVAQSLQDVQYNDIDSTVQWVGDSFLIGDSLKVDYKIEKALLVRDYDAGQTQSPASNALTKKTALSSYNNVAGHVSNDEIVLFSPDQKLSQLGLNADPTLTYLEVLAPSSSQGTYQISNPISNIAHVNKNDPKDDTGFTYRLSNEVMRLDSSAVIHQDDYFLFKSSTNWSSLGLKTTWDINNDSYGQAAWKITISGTNYPISDVLPDGSLVLQDSGTLPKTNQSNVSFSLKNSSNTEVVSKTDGQLIVSRRGRLDLSNSNILVRGSLVSAGSFDDIKHILNANNYYVKLGSNQYSADFATGQSDQLYIRGYSDGDTSGTSAVVYQRLVDSALGFFHYNGITLTTGSNNLETQLGIVEIDENTTDDTSATSLKQNYLLLLATDSGTDYYAISDIDGTTIKLSGPKYDWGLNGQDINFSVIHYEKLPVQVPTRIDPRVEGMNFDYLDRSGNAAVFSIDTGNQESPLNLSSSIMNKTRKKDQIIESISQTENITFEIQTREVSEE